MLVSILKVSILRLILTQLHNNKIYNRTTIVVCVCDGGYVNCISSGTSAV